MMWPSFTVILSGFFVAYILHSIWTLASLFIPPSCTPSSDSCIPYYLHSNPKLQVVIFSSVNTSPVYSKDVQLVAKIKDFDYSQPFDKKLDFVLPEETCRNGTLFLHMFVLPRKYNIVQWRDASRPKDSVYQKIPLTNYQLPASATFQLLSGGKANQNSRPVSHLKTIIGFNILTGVTHFPRLSMPAELLHYLSLTEDGQFLPMVHYDFLNDRLRNVEEITKNTSKMESTLRYSPFSIGKLRLSLQMVAAFRTLSQLGFSDKDLDEVKGILADTNMYLLSATIFISSIHLLFDFLALKNDVSFWRSRRSLVGLSSRTVLWRAFSTAVIFVYLFDEETSLLVLVPAGISTLIEIWKVQKVIPVDWRRLRLKTVALNSEEQKTREFDAESMRYLSYILYPLCLGAALYSLIYESHKSWYSWCIHSLVNGVYAFGFLFMLPQLFINYRLKSVAHLPWRCFMYKAFNTFIDDIFAFIITMPTAHRIACFRDDFVFLVYLYQRWLYPVDKSRIDETTVMEEELLTTEAKKRN